MQSANRRIITFVLLVVPVVLLFISISLRSHVDAQTGNVYKYLVRVLYFPPNTQINGSSFDGWFNVCPIKDAEDHNSLSFCTNLYYSKYFKLNDLGFTNVFTGVASFEYLKNNLVYLNQSFIDEKGLNAYGRDCPITGGGNLLFAGTPGIASYRPYPNSCPTLSSTAVDLPGTIPFKSQSAYIYPTKPTGSSWTWKLQQTLITDTQTLRAQSRACSVIVSGIDWNGCGNAWQTFTDTNSLSYSSFVEYHFIGYPPGTPTPLPNTPTLASIINHRQSVTYKATVEGDRAKTRPCPVNVADGSINFIGCPFVLFPTPAAGTPSIVGYDAYILTVKTPLSVLDITGATVVPTKVSPICATTSPGYGNSGMCNYPYY